MLNLKFLKIKNWKALLSASSTSLSIILWAQGQDLLAIEIREVGNYETLVKLEPLRKLGRRPLDLIKKQEFAEKAAKELFSKKGYFDLENQLKKIAGNDGAMIPIIQMIRNRGCAARDPKDPGINKIFILPGLSPTVLFHRSKYLKKGSVTREITISACACQTQQGIEKHLTDLRAALQKYSMHKGAEQIARILPYLDLSSINTTYLRSENILNKNGVDHLYSLTDRGEKNSGELKFKSIQSLLP